MNSFFIYIGYFYIFLGAIFLLIPLIYLEVGRPKDLIKAGLNLLIGVTLIVKNRVFENSSLFICSLLTVLMIFYVYEIFLSRWNQLTDKEKNKLKTIVELRMNLSKILKAINLGLKNFRNSLNFLKFENNKENIGKKKWVRNDKNDKIEI